MFKAASRLNLGDIITYYPSDLYHPCSSDRVNVQKSCSVTGVDESCGLILIRLSNGELLKPLSPSKQVEVLEQTRDNSRVFLPRLQNPIKVGRFSIE